MKTSAPAGELENLFPTWFWMQRLSLRTRGVKIRNSKKPCARIRQSEVLTLLTGFASAVGRCRRLSQRGPRGKQLQKIYYGVLAKNTNPWNLKPCPKKSSRKNPQQPLEASRPRLHFWYIVAASDQCWTKTEGRMSAHCGEPSAH